MSHVRATLCVRISGQPTPVILDRHRTLGESALQPGCIVSVVDDAAPNSDARRQYPLAGHLVELTPSAQTGAPLRRRQVDTENAPRVYGLVAGENLIGRDPATRVHLATRDVSRRHAQITIAEDGTAAVHDLGSANGVEVNDQTVTDAPLRNGDRLRLGTRLFRYDALVPGLAQLQSESALTPRVAVIPAPEIVPRFEPRDLHLPTQPHRPRPSRMPVLAALAPLLGGIAMFALTKSPYSLILVVLSPLTLAATWLDSRFVSGCEYRRELAAYRQSVRKIADELADQQQRERAVRQQANPGSGAALWNRRPEHQTFLELRFGAGTDLSLTAIPTAERGELPDDVWAQIVDLHDRFETISDVPVLEKLSSAGAIGVTGSAGVAEEALRALIVQVATSHSPADAVVAAFCEPRQLPGWSWLKWLPHTASPHSPISGDHLASTADGAQQLTTRLEEVLGERSRSPTHGQARSHLPAGERPIRHHHEAAAPSEHSPVVIAVVIGNPGVDPARLVHIAEAGPDADMHVLWLGESAQALPAACRTWLHIEDDLTAALHRVRSASSIPVTRLDRLDARRAGQIARALAPRVDSGALVVDETDLPARVRLSEIGDTDLSEPLAIERRWKANDSLMSEWGTDGTRVQALNADSGLNAYLGVGTNGTFVLNLREQGPHALIGGTTGSGKSEFLQTWIMAMAAEYAPDRLTFLLVDYKGGAAFAECVGLPHTVGLVTDLDPHLVQRTLISLRAELTRREHLFNAVGAKDLLGMERLRDPRTPPTLVIVVDEFAALVADVPEFVTGIVDIAARGRSLGVHLILATQRPSGVVNDNLRANANLRVALRMADEQDSTDVLGIPDAAHFSASTPGRAAVRVGPGLVQHFQTAYLGAPMILGREAAQITIAELPFQTARQWLQPATRDRTGAQAQREIEAMRDAMLAAAEGLRLDAPRRPWLDALPSRLALPLSESSEMSESSGLSGRPGSSASAQTAQRPQSADEIVLGVADDPQHQRQQIYAWSPAADGHLRVIGSAGSGRTQVLRTLAWQLSDQPSRTAATHIYVIDAAGAGLEQLDTLPTVGAVIAADDRERIQRLLRQLDATATERLALLRRAKASAVDELPTATADGLPRVYVLIDDLAAMQEQYEFARGFDVIGSLAALFATGRDVGIHFAFTTSRPGGLPATIASSLGQTLVLRVTDAAVGGLLDVDTGVLDDAPPGRGIVIGGMCGGLEAQIGVPHGAVTVTEQAAVLAEAAARLADIGAEPTPSIRRLPETVALDSLPALDVDHAPVFAVADDTLAPVGLPAHEPFLVQGRSNDENSAVLGVLTRALATSRPAAQSILITPKTSPLDAAISWSRVANDEAQVINAIDEILGAVEAPAARPSLAQFDTAGWLADDDWLSAAPSHSGVQSKQPVQTSEPTRPALDGDQLLIVIDHTADFVGTPAESRLAALVAHCRREGITCLVDVDPATLPAAWELHGAVRTIRCGLLLRPENDDSDRYLRANVPADDTSRWPAGRGYLVAGGQTRLVQVAK
ncbi:FtsK/SpoIIIE domain-containing protein [Pseudoclavibacter sp. 13-3]|uniref:FtsK/SpoIIIE domain-containing protein n=1 Tax=Pseudoclavibacter sp. 13-3 TaxID=2901228 RepID=UPI001E404B6F|nr:FtsK/SpoIIIE domain-containing protein [Pseudoclavibacter sp. 13-3]MCD7100901.1 FHA domain-containing protein [Pseudoclavibacter sp. 13-3]